MILAFYVAKALVRGFALTLVILVLLLSLAALVAELDDIGEGRYGMLEALLVVASRIPERARDLAAVSALVGGIVGLGGLATGSELIVMRAAGLAPIRVALFALGTALPIAGTVFVIAETVVPPLSQAALRRKQVSLRGPDAAMADEVLWIREGRTFLRIGSVRDGETLLDVQAFTWSEAGRLQEVLAAREAVLLPAHQWRLRDVERHAIPPPASVERADVLVADSPLTEHTLRLLLSPLDLLSLSRLWRDLGESGETLRQDEVRRMFWRRLTAPFLIMAMFLLAVPFAVGPGASGGLGRRLAVGAVIGVLAHVGVEVVAYLGALLDVEPMVSSLLPVVLVTTAASLLITRVR